MEIDSRKCGLITDEYGTGERNGYSLSQCCGSRPFYTDPDPAFHLLSNLIRIRIRLFNMDPDPDPSRFKEVTYLKQYIYTS
jgi:hypothetical protein